MQPRQSGELGTRPGSGFTLLFEAFAMTLVTAMPNAAGTKGWLLRGQTKGLSGKEDRVSPAGSATQFSEEAVFCNRSNHPNLPFRRFGRQTRSLKEKFSLRSTTFLAEP
jgi:hypothetical protein